MESSTDSQCDETLLRNRCDYQQSAWSLSGIYTITHVRHTRMDLALFEISFFRLNSKNGWQCCCMFWLREQAVTEGLKCRSYSRRWRSRKRSAASTQILPPKSTRLTDSGTSCSTAKYSQVNRSQRVRSVQISTSFYWFWSCNWWLPASELHHRPCHGVVIIRL